LKNTFLASGAGLGLALPFAIPATFTDLLFQLGGALASYYVLEFIKNRKLKSKK
jgi:hypothetical protein